MSSEKRNYFLQQIWQAYPSVTPAQFEVVGRILSLTSSSLVLQSGTVLALHSTVEIKPVLRAEQLNQQLDVQQVLVPGDLVGVELHSGQVKTLWLLAPNTLQISPLQLKNYWHFVSFQQEIRNLFLQWGLSEANTPTLVTCPGTEPYIDVFSCELVIGSHKQKLYLPTSPELHLKKLLALDPRPLFELKKVFRNNENSPHHEPEFTMLEWYRPYSDLSLIRSDLENLIRHLYADQDIQFETQSVAQLFQKHLGFDLTSNTSREQLLQLGQRLAMNLRPDDDINDVFTALWVDFIEPKIDPQTPLFVTDYPPFQAAYARINQRGWADRFELFWQGFEIANAFHEVNDPAIQRQRMEADLELKRSLGKETFPLDEEFLGTLEYGMPPSGGIAVGVERLFMAIHGLTDIRELHPFSRKKI